VSFTWDDGNIKIVSSEPIHCIRHINSDLQMHPVSVNDEMYEWYVPTGLQFKITSATSVQDLQITISYANKLTEIEAKHAAVCMHDGSGSWIPLQAEVNSDEKVLSCKAEKIGTLAVFINDYWYSEFTQKTVGDEFPIWTWIRQSRESVGQRFMNYFGMQIETAYSDIDLIKAMKFIELTPVQMIDWAYVYEMPIINDNDTVDLKANGKSVPLLPDLRSFFYNPNGEGGILDRKNRRLYSLYRYEPLIVSVNGKDIHVSPVHHHIWNAFDEFGLLMGVRRLHLEKNADFKERILDAARYPANSSDLGMSHGIGRELDMVKRITWQNDLKNLVIRGKNIDVRTLRVDGQKIQPNMYAVSDDGAIVIYAMNQGISHQVSFIQGIKKSELHNKEDAELHALMFQPDGQATPLLENWVSYINQVAPVMWGKFNWDEGFWDTIDPDLTGVGYLPNMWDSDIEIWKDYKFNAKSPNIL